MRCRYTAVARVASRHARHARHARRAHATSRCSARTRHHQHGATGRALSSLATAVLLGSQVVWLWQSCGLHTLERSTARGGVPTQSLLVLSLPFARRSTHTRLATRPTACMHICSTPIARHTPHPHLPLACRPSTRGHRPMHLGRAVEGAVSRRCPRHRIHHDRSSRHVPRLAAPRARPCSYYARLAWQAPQRGLHKFSRASAKMSCLNGSWLRKEVSFLRTWREMEALVSLAAVKFSKRNWM